MFKPGSEGKRQNPCGYLASSYNFVIEGNRMRYKWTSEANIQPWGVCYDTENGKILGKMGKILVLWTIFVS